MVKALHPESIQKRHGGLQEEPALEELRKPGRASEPENMEMEGIAKDGSSVWTEWVIHLHFGTPAGKPPVSAASPGYNGAQQHYRLSVNWLFLITMTGCHNPAAWLAHRFLLAKGQSRRAERVWAAPVGPRSLQEVNDRFGHHWGDQLLKTVGERLTEILRNVDTVAAWAAMNLPSCCGNGPGGRCVKVAEKILETFPESPWIAGRGRTRP